MDHATLDRIEWAGLPGRRPRAAGSNARLGPHGQQVDLPLARLWTSDGACGLGRAHLTPELAERLLGLRVADLWDEAGRVRPSWRAVECPLWDLRGRSAGQPVYALLGGASPCSAPCYDTSLYFDDLHLADDGAAADVLAAEATQGLTRGHRHFKVKVGRGAMHMDLEGGLRRDIAVVRAVRRAIGPGGRLMLDANNGYNLALAKRLLEATADCHIDWLEEPFHEDPRYLEALHAWLDARGLATRVADGEGDASPHLLDWARRGLVDIVQYDLLGYGFGAWIDLGQQLDGWQVGSAPHHYGQAFGNWATGHLAAPVRRFEAVEWDHVEVDGLDTGGYRIVDGRVQLPEAPGWGLAVDEAAFAAAGRLALPA